jgi:hypothetical protein
MFSVEKEINAVPWSAASLILAISSFVGINEIRACSERHQSPICFICCSTNEAHAPTCASSSVKLHSDPSFSRRAAAISRICGAAEGDTADNGPDATLNLDMTIPTMLALFKSKTAAAESPPPPRRRPPPPDTAAPTLKRFFSLSYALFLETNTKIQQQQQKQNKKKNKKNITP